MSLRALRRLSCTMLPSACGCKNTGAMFCSPAAVQRLSAVKKLQSLHSTGSVRAFSTGPDHNKLEEDRPTTFKERVTGMWKKYGKLAICTYIGVYAGTLGSIFLALDFGVFNASTFGFDHAAAIAKVCDILESVSGNTTLPQYMKENPKVGTFAVAWVMTKFTEPLRLATTVVIVPPIARFWNKLVANKIDDDVTTK